ncbi:hypothetical protein [Vibrio parahaemolyticus]|uniref:hypothetical protein n=1 Tax=Vibrio parahaemolyticus TaxID=670 RepID=UPI0011234DAD|nr:hypothetical protein [Vibrio parahaemolyticus]TOE48240.1 hypothetical protein CGJ41_20205 [Vibrio parahaemolyticus]
MYNTSSFLESGKKILKLGVHDSSIQDANTMFLQSLSRVTRKLESDLSEKEREKRYFTNALRSLKDYDKYRDLELRYQYGSLDDEEIQELKERINKRNQFVHYLKLKDLEDSSRRHNKADDAEDEENGDE